MKKVLLTMLTLFATCGVWAQTTADVSGTDNAAYVVGGTYPVGAEIVVPIKLKNNIDAQAGSFYVTLQEGLEFVPDPEDETQILIDVLNSDHVPMSNVNTGMVALFSAKNNVLPENLLCIHLTSASDLPVGEYEIKVGTLNISNADNGNEVIANDEFVSTIMLTEGLVLDEDAETFPVAKYTGNVTVNRTLKADQWSTIVLPFAVTKTKSDKAFGSDAQFASLDGWEFEYEMAEDESSFTPTSINIKFATKKVTSMSGLSAGVPYLIKTTKDIEKLEFASVTINSNIPNSTEKAATLDGETADSYVAKNVGTYVKTTIPNNGLFISGNKFYYSKGSTNIKGFRTWFELNTVLNEPFSLAEAKVGFSVDGDATSIDGISTQRIVEGVYDLSGRKIQIEGNDLNKLQKGVYIIDGKKVTVK